MAFTDSVAGHLQLQAKLVSLVGGLLIAAACGSEGDDVSASSGASPEQPAPLAEACSQDQMVRYGPSASSLEAMVDMSDVVAEVEVSRRYETTAVTDEAAAEGESPNYRLMVDMTVRSLFSGEASSNQLTVYIALATTGHDGEEVVLVGNDLAAGLQEGQTAILGLTEGEAGEYEVIPGATLLVNGETVSPVCPDREVQRPLGEQIAAMNATAVRRQLEELAASNP